MLNLLGMKRPGRKSRGAGGNQSMRRLNRTTVRRVSRTIYRRLGAPCQSTMLDMVREVQPEVASASELEAVVLRLVRTGAVQLCGSFRGARL